jgi:Icc protein
MMKNGNTSPATQFKGFQEIVSWVHFGDLHMTTRDQQNYRDLQTLVDEVNLSMTDSSDFIYLPGDNADHGKPEEYEAVRDGLDRLLLPWHSIIGDHDVHPKSFDNYLRYMSPRTYYDFKVGNYQFLALNAFDAASPKPFDLLPEQLGWLEQRLAEASAKNQRNVLFLHVYPSELKTTAQPLSELVRKHRVLLVDMGHTHYNEVANDGSTLYTATRSTGQIEEGPAGFSVTNLDQDVVSWRFKELGSWPLVMITTPADERLITNPHSTTQVIQGKTKVRVKAWSDRPIEKVTILANGAPPSNAENVAPSVWEADWDCSSLSSGTYALQAIVSDVAGRRASDEIRAVVASPGAYIAAKRAVQDQGNALGAWPERGLLGTQLGPNKNGRKW